MRNRALHDSLREFALESAAFLTDEIRDGAELEFDVVDGGHGGGPSLYRYEPRTSGFLDQRWEQLRQLPGCKRAADELGTGAAPWLRVNGLRGEQAEPALRAMLQRLYEDATSFGFPEERFERLYGEVETTLYRDAVQACILVPLAGAAIECDRIELDGGMSLVAGNTIDAPPEAAWPEQAEGEPAVLCLLEREVPAGEQIPVAEADERFRGLVTALRLWAPGGIALQAPGWQRSGEARWAPAPLGGPGTTRGGAWTLTADEEPDLREFLRALGDTPARGPVGWALGRFEMGCERIHDAEALSDYLLGLRALLDATSDAGEASLPLRVAALCAEEGQRRGLRRRIEAAVSLERFLMGGGGGSLKERIGSESPRALVAEMEAHLRALLRDVLCGYLEADLKGVADDILLEAAPEPFALAEERHSDVRVEARDLRRPAEPEPEPEHESPALEADTTEVEAVVAEQPEPVAAAAAPRQHQLDGVTESADWGWDDPEDYSAPV